jgi:hypothetical protein
LETGRESSDIRVARRLWVRGSPCSGKSTIVRALSTDHGLSAYHCDDHWVRHVHLADVSSRPHMVSLRTMTWDEIWMRVVSAQVEDELACYREQFPLILSDLDTLPPDAPVIAEGAALLPECVAPPLTDMHQAIWIVPTEEFQRRTYKSRGPWVGEILRQCSNPAEAWERWMARDAAFAQRIVAQASSLSLQVLLADGRRTIPEMRTLAEAWLSPSLRR